MAARQIDFPDDFYAEMVKTKQRTGKTIRRQVLEALCVQNGWGVERIPIDGRMTFGWQQSTGDVEIPKFPEAIASDGWPDKKEEF
jgi:hypothetical protein